MSKHDKDHYHKGEGVSLVGSPTDLINLLIKDVDKNKQVTEELINEGPKHKQVLNALLLKRLYKLVQTIEKSSSTEFAIQEGFQLIKEKHDQEIALPITIPINVGDNVDKKAVAKAVSHVPEHEVLAYAMCLQVIEWAIKVTEEQLAIL